MRPARSRGPAILTCLLGTPAWLVALTFLGVSIGLRGGWRWLEAVGVLIAAIGLFLVLIRRIEWDGLALVIASVAGWILIARPVMSTLGFLSYLALLPIGTMAAVAAILGGWALIRDGDGDTTTQAMALLGCSSLPLFLAAICLLFCGQDARRPEPRHKMQPIPRERTIPKSQGTRRVCTRCGRSITFHQKTSCVLVPPGRPIPSPKAAVDLVGVAAPSPRNPVVRFRDDDRGPDQFERPSVRERRAVRSDPSILEPRMAGRENTQERSARCS
jgi:hypothetical protein